MVMRAEERPRAEERLSHLEGAYDHLATKADVADVRTDVAESENRVIRQVAEGRAETADLRTEVRTGFAEAEARADRQIAELRMENAELRKENAEAEARANQQFAEARRENAENQARNTRWIIAVGGLIVAVITLLDRLLG